MTIQYHKSGDYFLPNLVLEETETQPIGKYGRMRKCYLKEHRPVLYSNLLLSGKLVEHLAEIDGVCEERMELLTRQMTKCIVIMFCAISVSPMQNICFEQATSIVAEQQKCGIADKEEVDHASPYSDVRKKTP